MLGQENIPKINRKFIEIELITVDYVNETEAKKENLDGEYFATRQQIHEIMNLQIVSSSVGHNTSYEA